MVDKKSILIVDDNSINREVLKEILSAEYKVREAANGQEALDILRKDPEKILAVLSDILMPVMDGFQLLEAVREDDNLSNIPIIVMTANNESQEEIKALRMGAWDFVTKPYYPGVILGRLRNAIARSEVAALEQMRFIASHDQLTGLYNRNHFMKATEKMVRSNPDKTFVFVCYGIDRFQMINTFYGGSETRRLLKYVSSKILEHAEGKENLTYGRVENEIFALCFEYKEERIEELIAENRDDLAAYGADYDVEPFFGLYVIKNNFMSVETMFSRASMAAREGEGNYLFNYSYYTDEMDAKIKKEQEIINNMNKALENREFVVYLQPKYNIHNDTVAGAEALVRWVHPEKGMISPGDFIPVFENNGFITKLDYYVWEETCRLLRRWMDMGLNPAPVSVNVSRVDVYNSRLAESITNLVDKYKIPHDLFELEITESAYAYDPRMLIKLVEDLHKEGFKILMDDFGNGYSSLSILKDIDVDVLKLDMLFLANTGDAGRGENILASIVRMAKWLKIPVIIEGVEEADQVKFLKSVGCDYVQGYFYAKPMPAEEYEELISEEPAYDRDSKALDLDDFEVDSLFQSNPQMKMLFGGLLQALAIFEFDGDRIDFVRTNEGYFDMFGSDDLAIRSGNPLDVVDEKYRTVVLDAFQQTANTHGTAEVDYVRYDNNKKTIWVNAKLRYLRDVGDKHLVLALMSDVTAQKKIDFELEKYREAIMGEGSDENLMLVVDDVPANRAILKKIFESQYTIIEAVDGQDALEKLEEMPSVSVILLDINMPRLNGWEFLQRKRTMSSIANIPVIIISAEDKLNEQEEALDMGINDYIVKPFVPEIVKRRVSNAMDSIRLMQETVKKYDSVANMARVDKATGFYHLDSAISLVKEYLDDFSDDLNVFLTFSVEDYEKTARDYMDYYDKPLDYKVSRVIRRLFRADDIGFRPGAGVFAVFAKSYKDIDMLKKRMTQFIDLIAADDYQGKVEISCSMGAALSPSGGVTYEELYENAEKAREIAKKAGENKSYIYNEAK